ncbi:uncharacterized protein LOC114200326 [Eumetopias jubatus]|uniref:uncharacterized protein LOC114200326 n=1 Tax=Eumetopias jubatus TaxID=34886 RepID=UPI001016D4F7|nr:uncharacterized protein LOC114200326 [Eumetopias jubatus]
MVLGETTSLEATLQLAGAQFLPRAWLEMNQLLRPSAGQMWGGVGVGGRPLEGRGTLAFEGLFVAGIGGSYPLGNWEEGRETQGGGAGGRPTLRLRGLSGRSLVWNRAVTGETLCLLTSKAASAASAAFEATPQNTPSGRLNPPPARLQKPETKVFPSAWLSLATRWLSLGTQRYLFLRVSELGQFLRFSGNRDGYRELKRLYS